MLRMRGYDEVKDLMRIGYEYAAKLYAAGVFDRFDLADAVKKSDLPLFQGAYGRRYNGYMMYVIWHVQRCCCCLFLVDGALGRCGSRPAAAIFEIRAAHVLTRSCCVRALQCMPFVLFVCAILAGRNQSSFSSARCILDKQYNVNVEQMLHECRQRRQREHAGHTICSGLACNHPCSGRVLKTFRMIFRPFLGARRVFGWAMVRSVYTCDFCGPFWPSCVF